MRCPGLAQATYFAALVLFGFFVLNYAQLVFIAQTPAFHIVYRVDKMRVYCRHYLLHPHVPMARIVTFAFLLASLLPTTLWAEPTLRAKTDEPLAATKTARHEPSPRKIARYARRLIARYDTDGNGILNSAEWDSMQGQPAVIDLDQNGRITSAELILHIMEYARTRRLGKSSHRVSETPAPNHNPANGSKQLSTTAAPSSDADVDSTDKLPRKYPDAPFHVPAKERLNSLPNWFSQRDKNGDGQLSLAEFSPNRSRESVKAFQKLDTNRDGLVTPQESVKGKGQ